MIQDEESRNTLGATLFAVLMGLSALCLVGWVMLSGGCADTVSNKEIAEISPVIEEAKETASQIPPMLRRIEESTEYMDLVAERDAIAGERLAAVSKGREAEKELERLKRKFKMVEDQNESLDAKSAALGGAAAAAAALKLRADDADKNTAEMESALEALKTRIEALEKESEAAKKSAEGLKADLKKAVGAKNQLQSTNGELETKLAALTKQKAEIDADKETLDGKVVELEKELAAAKKAAKGNMAAAEAEGDLQNKVAELTASLAAAKKASAESAAAMKVKETEMAKQLADAKAKSQAMSAAGEQDGGDKIKALTAELEAARKKMDASSKAWTSEKQKLATTTKTLGEEKTKLATNVSEQQKEIDRLKKLLDESKAKAAAMAASVAAAPALPALDLPLLVNDSSQLALYSKPLFTKLNGIDDNVASREKIYAELKSSERSDLKLTVPFRSGSSAVGSADRQKINALVDGAGEGAEFLVVGYASTDGSAEGNRKLSSERASSVAQRIAEKLGDEGVERVQAIYFGQTERFDGSRKAPNRVVEIWSVK